MLVLFTIIIIVFSYILNNLTPVNCAFPHYYKEKYLKSETNEGEPLILTNLIKENKLAEARNASKVPPELFLGVESYSGFLTVNEEYNGNLFFWFFPSEGNYSKDPLVLWLQGGPGASSMMGLFNENGPFFVNDNSELQLREHSWTKNHSVLFIDNPIGTGFSFTSGGYCTNQTCVGNGLFEALQQFYTVFSELQLNKFYAAGESYAGKYVPALGYTILKQNPEAKIKINLQGLAIGNGIVDPDNQLYYNEYVYQLGLVDFKTKTTMLNMEEESHKFIKIGEFGKAFEIMQQVMMHYDTIFSRAAGPIDVYNYLKEQGSESNYVNFLNKPEIRAALHVEGVNFETDTQVDESLNDDIMKSIAPWLTELLSYYRVLIYNGQLDIVAAYPLTLKYLQMLQFDGSEEYAVAKRYQWFVDGDLAGYYKTAGNLSEVLIRNSGHMVPQDQPKWAYELLLNFTQNVPLDTD